MLPIFRLAGQAITSIMLSKTAARSHLKETTRKGCRLWPHLLPHYKEVGQIFSPKFFSMELASNGTAESPGEEANKANTVARRNEALGRKIPSTFRPNRFGESTYGPTWLVPGRSKGASVCDRGESAGTATGVAVAASGTMAEIMSRSATFKPDGIAAVGGIASVHPSARSAISFAVAVGGVANASLVLLDFGASAARCNCEILTKPLSHSGSGGLRAEMLTGLVFNGSAAVCETAGSAGSLYSRSWINHQRVQGMPQRSNAPRMIGVRQANSLDRKLMVFITRASRNCSGGNDHTINSSMWPVVCNFRSMSPGRSAA